MNIYRFEYIIVATGLKLASRISARNALSAWSVFEALHPPRRCTVIRFSTYEQSPTGLYS